MVTLYGNLGYVGNLGLLQNLVSRLSHPSGAILGSSIKMYQEETVTHKNLNRHVK